MAKAKSQKQIDKRIETAYYAAYNGIQINIMAISKVFDVGRAQLAKSDDEETLRSTLRAFVETIREN